MNDAIAAPGGPAEEGAVLLDLQAEADGVVAMFRDDFTGASRIWAERDVSVGCAFGQALLQFLRAALTFEDTDMDAALALLPPIHRAAQAAATAAGRKSGWLSWGSQGEVGLLPKLVALRGDVAVGGSEMICALIGLFRMSVSGHVSIAAPSFHTIEIVVKCRLTVDWDAISGT
eukprot:m.175885 g.175885  ORF g.175885 m.175885 type:complete len:174 (+) comp14894_c0_seq4:1168-1689(+)